MERSAAGTTISSSDQNKEVAAEILLWPKTSPSNRGFVVGWRETSGKFSFSPVKTIIAAGIVPFQDQLSPKLLRKDYIALCSRVKELKDSPCYSCSCTKDTETRGSAICSGCTRRLCFEELDVVAFYDPSSSSFNLDDIPLISLSDRGYPIILRKKDKGCPLIAKQILLYDRNSACIDKDCVLYRHSLAPGDSFFSRNLLVRLTHAGTVLDAVVSAAHPFNKQEGVPTATTSTTRPTVVEEVDAKDVVQSNTKGNSKLATRVLMFLETHSLLARHCIQCGERKQQRRRRLLPLADALLLLLWPDAKIRRDGERVSDPCPKFSSQSLLLIDESQYESAARSISDCNALVQATIDAAIGLLFGVLALVFLFLRSSQPTASFLLPTTALVESHYQVLSDCLQWLEHFPLGFKLNESLLENVGREIQRLWNVHEWTVLRIVSVLSSEQHQLLHSIAIGFAALLSFALGGSGVAALLFDGSRLLTLHVSGFAWFTLRVYSFELYMLTALWRLFRGKKRNVLRHRTDTMEYDSMQLLLGTILFAVALFLFTTVFVYHAFFTVLHLAAVAVAFPFALLYIFLQVIPWGSLLLRQQRPGLFTREVFLVDQENDESTDDAATDVTRLGLRFGSYSSILSGTVLPPVKSILLWIVSFVAGSLVGSSASSAFLDSIFPSPPPAYMVATKKL